MTRKRSLITVKDIHKEFVLPSHRGNTVKHAFVNIVKRNNKTIQKVLDGVSFEVNEGDFFGIVGRNGSGKSTLLKILAGVYTPTSGSLEINGGLTPFIELGVGFNPELSGRDNVYLNGALLGFTRGEMDAIYDEIVEFAELEPFMDQKLKNYSSGMQVRLAFSVAIKAKNEILIFDEVLAVGDEAFQRKCLDVFDAYKAEGQTVILVTHEMETVKKFCNRAIFIHDGKIIDEGNPHSVADSYSRKNQAVVDAQEDEKISTNQINVNMTAALYGAQDNEMKHSFDVGQEAILDVQWEKDERVAALMVDLFKASGEHISGFKSKGDGHIIKSSETRQAVRFWTDLTPGRYYFKLSLRDKDDKDIEVLYRACDFLVTKNWPKDRSSWSGLVPFRHEWI